MLTRVTISNYRSFLGAPAGGAPDGSTGTGRTPVEAALSPFTLVIGANGSGKTNFLRFFRDVNTWAYGIKFGTVQEADPRNPNILPRHRDFPETDSTWRVERGQLPYISSDSPSNLFPGQSLHIYQIDPRKVSRDEAVGNMIDIAADGSGVTNALDAFKTGVEEERFDAVEDAMRTFLPDLKKIGFSSAGNSVKRLEFSYVDQRESVPGSLASDGTRLLLALLTILHQRTPPPLLLIEDLDHSLHPRLFESFVDYLRRVCAERDVQVIATTHNPYLVDCFQDDPDAVLLVEKSGGSSTIRALGDEMRALEKNGGRPMSLSKLYLSGLLDRHA